MSKLPKKITWLVNNLKGDKYDDYTWKVDGEKVRSWYQFAGALKKVAGFTNLGTDWVSIFGDICSDLNIKNVGVGVMLNGVNFYVEKNKKEAA